MVTAGGRLPAWIGIVALSLPPRLSRTVRRAVKLPAWL